MNNKERCSSGLHRREFIKISGLSSIAVLCSHPMTEKSSKEETASFINKSIPVLKKCDVLVVGGGFAGVSAAVRFARSGKKVVLVERRIYLGREITSVYRPWFDHSNAHMPEVVRACVEPDIEQPERTKTLLRFDHVKRTLEDILFASGVEIVYASNVVQVLGENETLQGIVIGNKSGRQAILSKLVLDCTETASVVHLTDQQFKESLLNAEYSRTLEFTDVEPSISRSIEVPHHLQIKDNTVTVQRGYVDEFHYYIDCPMVFNAPKFDAGSVTQREAEAWEKSIKVAEYLYQKVPEFENAYLTNSAYQLHGMYTLQMIDSNYANERPYLNEHITIQNEEIALSAFATSYANLFCISEASVLTENQADYILTPLGACDIAVSVSEKIVNTWSLLTSNTEIETFKENEQTVVSYDTVITEKYSPQRGKPYDRIQIDSENIAVIDEVDILVVGGGTSGAPAAYTSANAGKRTMVVDMNPGFGGTGTYGGVQSYWGPGNYYGLTAEHIRKTKDINASISNFFRGNGPPKWSIQAKLAMWLDEIRTSGAQILWNSFVVGSIMMGNKVVGAVISTPQGVVAVKSKIVIDASGDGDVAAFSGASFVLGSDHNQVPIWYAMRRQPKPGPTQSVFQSTVDVTNIEDYTRSVHVGLRSGGNNLHDHQAYLAPRESRHILGDAVITLSDSLTYREWNDIISYHRSNTDMKGYHASDWFRVGLIPPNLTIEIPFKAIIPQQVENLVVAGKAFSAHHDAFAALRMQHDLENLGGITALAAIQAIDDKVLVRDIDVKKLQRKLVSLGLLPENIIDRKIKPRNYSSEELKSWIQQFDPEKSLKSLSNTKMHELRHTRIPFVEVCTSPSEKAVPVLEEELTHNTGKMKLRIALALAMHGSDSGASTIYQEIENQLSSGSLPQMKEYVEHSGGSDRTPPDQGAAPICANLIYALGMTRSELNIAVIERVSEIFRADTIGDFQNKDNALFFYIDAACYAAGLIGSEKVIPHLENIHANRYLNKRSIKSGIEESHVLERLSLMELILGRGLARSGSAQGYEVLIDYLDDMRAILTEFAHGTLMKITHQDFGKDTDAWNKWLTANENTIEPVALIERPFG
jgi:flavin-dependent dehydrogenase